jgi:hypothetical protein
LLVSHSWKDTHVGLRAAVERGPSEGARSGSTGPMWVSFQPPHRARSASKEGALPLPAFAVVLSKTPKSLAWVAIGKERYGLRPNSLSETRQATENN